MLYTRASAYFFVQSQGFSHPKRASVVRYASPLAGV
jgi:hypothetical protein